MSDKLRAAAEAALEAITELDGYSRSAVTDKIARDAKQVLRAALAEHENEGGSNCTASQRMNPHFTNTINPIDFPKSKYTTPPRREWRGLTDEERLDTFHSYLEQTAEGRARVYNHLSYAEEELEAFNAGGAAAEAVLKEKNDV